MKHKYEGKIVQIQAPHSSRGLGYLFVEEVINNNILSGRIAGTKIHTAFYLSDGIQVTIIGEKKT